MAITDNFGVLSRPTFAPGGLRDAALQLLNSRRGRWALVLAVLMILLIAMPPPSSSMSSYRESLTKYYYSQSSNSTTTKNSAGTNAYAHQSPLVLSDTAVGIESGDKIVPQALLKGNPAFHLIIPQSEGQFEFCQFYLSSMVLNYPAATITKYGIGYPPGQTYQKDMDKIKGVNEFLKSRTINDDDLVLIVEADKTLFQLPSDVLIKQYQMLVREANARLAKQYKNGVNGHALNQTIFFSPAKLCDEWMKNEPACAAVPEPPLPPTIYGTQTDSEPGGSRNRPKYLSSDSIIGPAGDLRKLFAAAVQKITEHSENSRWADRSHTSAHTIFASLFGEQEFARSINSGQTDKYHWPEWLSEKTGIQVTPGDPSILSQDLVISAARNYEFSMGLDYYSILFQPMTLAASDELTFLTYSDTPSLRAASHADPLLPSLPIPLTHSSPPFETAIPGSHLLPKANLLHYINELKPDPALDTLPPANTSFADLPLLTNTYLLSIPAALSLSSPGEDPAHHTVSRSQLYTTLWFSPHARALLRRYLRTMPQGPIAMHSSYVGGDWRWDTRGGLGGVWTGEHGDVYREWGLDICKDMEVRVFGDDKGPWLREGEDPQVEQNKPVLKRGLGGASGEEGERRRGMSRRELYGVPDWIETA
ncbi:hypothetical protein EJ05DRAFT_352787 [Pseudovirgaria hyperparasitica]|uniref:Uncharacterized protein n=1 Tax=Pseudovirgaria hyperparasitica TaxID=470096 RepID=A0A6A6W6K3_9PEZI|nr:uncharacterized protein EJ05DRAFT_352787 [Pseudovirgaria hyperparasitica]KAF2758502.1 hypothetical protein EJ05DRAFT_352787 [Pseudovirgaria hyperparasitica]